MIENTPKIAYCVPTYNHKEVLSQVLPFMVPLYSNYGIDIIYYDSSTDDGSVEVIQSFQKVTDSVTVEKVDYNGDEKYFHFISNPELIDKYDYIWIVKDRAVFYEPAIAEIVRVAQTTCDKGETPDIIFLPVEKDVSKLVQPESGVDYDNPLDFFRDFGSLSTSWEMVLFNTKLLKNVDWEYIENNTLAGMNCPFNQTFLLFYLLYKKCEGFAKAENRNLDNNIRISVLDREKTLRGCSSLANSMWRNETVELWAYKWPEVMNSLPDYYDKYKEKIILDGVAVPPVWGSFDNINYLKAQGIFTQEVWNNIRERWNTLSKLPVEYVDLLMKADSEENKDELGLKIYEAFLNNIEKRNFEYAYILFLSLSAIRDAIGEEKARLLESFFDIYDLEHRQFGLADNELPFESSCQGLEDIFDKVSFLRLFANEVSRLKSENETLDKGGIPTNASIEELFVLKRQLRISQKATNYAIINMV